MHAEGRGYPGLLLWWVSDCGRFTSTFVHCTPKLYTSTILCSFLSVFPQAEQILTHGAARWEGGVPLEFAFLFFLRIPLTMRARFAWA